jgi:hypothetical protein
MKAREECRASADPPEPARLERFFRGDLTRDEARALVRHLLTGCPQCLRRTRRLWRLGSKGGGTSMVEMEATRAQLREIVGELEAVKLRLQTVKESLPQPGGESAGLPDAERDLGRMEVRAEVRTVIECVLHDWLAPAIADLQGAAALFPSASKGRTHDAAG